MAYYYYQIQHVVSKLLEMYILNIISIFSKNYNFIRKFIWNVLVFIYKVEFEFFKI